MNNFKQNILTKQIKGGIVGLLVGDALGVPYEFHERQSIRSLIEIEFETRIFPTNANFDIKGSGYVVDSLRAAHWLNNNRTYEETVKAAVALGNDTDTTACIAGGIAGLIHGFETIPKRWRDNLRGQEIYEPLLKRLLIRF